MDWWMVVVVCVGGLLIGYSTHNSLARGLVLAFGLNIVLIVFGYLLMDIANGV